MDGATIEACSQDELMDLGFDQIFRKKLEVKLKVTRPNKRESRAPQRVPGLPG